MRLARGTIVGVVPSNKEPKFGLISAHLATLGIGCKYEYSTIIVPYHEYRSIDSRNLRCDYHGHFDFGE